MATLSTLDVDLLASPVSSEEPAGPELRSASPRDAALYLSVRDARKRAIDAERRLRDFGSMTDEDRSYTSAPDPPDWQAVRQQAIEALNRSKDLWVTAWLIEALTRLHGFAGLRDGVLLAHRFCDRFWEHLHPRPGADGDMAIRFAQLAGLDGGGSAEGTLIAPIIHVPITGGATTGSFTLADYRDAVDLERKPPEIRRRRMEQGAVTIEVFNQSVAETNQEFLRTLRDDLEGASTALVELTEALRSKEAAHRAAGGRDFVPPSSNLREVLGECLRLCRPWVKEEPSRDVVRVTDGQVATGGRGGLGGSTEMPVARLTVETRQEAFETLLRVSNYFRQTEPHSPVSYALEQVVRWGRMSLPELLAELISDKATRDDIFKRAGIPHDPPDS
jgi:type VI secretion system protein ImpA